MTAMTLSQEKSYSPHTLQIDVEVIRTRARLPVAILRLKDRVNLGNAGQLEKKASELIAQGTRHLLIDLSEVPTMTSAGLRSLQIIHKMCMEDSPIEREIQTGMGHRSPYLKLLNPNPDLRRILSIAGFDNFFDVFEDEQEAVLSF